jgi:hypothetical protein
VVYQNRNSSQENIAWIQVFVIVYVSRDASKAKNKNSSDKAPSRQ